jgi:hypothetical protein
MYCVVPQAIFLLLQQAALVDAEPAVCRKNEKSQARE